MYKCYIIDDESHAIDTLVKYAKDSGLLEVAGTSQRPMEAVNYINEHQDIDITFLDIDMPEISGLDVADLIYNNTAIIFTTGHGGYAVQGFDKNISDFLLKPISFPRFVKSLSKVIESIKKTSLKTQKSDRFFFVNPGIKGKVLKINFDDVDYIEGLNNYIVIHTPTESHIIYLTMKEMEAGLPTDIFIRVHKSHIVNINKVTQIEGNKVIIDKKIVPVGSSFKDSLAQKINTHIIKTHR